MIIYLLTQLQHLYQYPDIELDISIARYHENVISIVKIYLISINYWWKSSLYLMQLTVTCMSVKHSRCYT